MIKPAIPHDIRSSDIIEGICRIYYILSYCILARPVIASYGYHFTLIGRQAHEFKFSRKASTPLSIIPLENKDAVAGHLLDDELAV